MKKIYIMILSLFCCLVCHAETTETQKPGFTRLDKIVAIVNREVITQSEVNKEIQRITKQLQQANQPLPSPGELKKQVVDILIGKSLQLQLCKANKIQIPTEEVDQTIAKIAKGNNISVSQLQTAVEQAGMNFKEYTAELHNQLMMQKLQQEQVVKTVIFTPDDVKKYLKENKDNFNRYNAYHVVDVNFPILENNAPQAQQIKKQAAAFSQQLQKGSDLDVAIKQYPTAEKNDLGWRTFSELPSLFQPKIAAMHLNAVSTPIQAPNGFHVLKLVETKGENHLPSEKDIKNLAFQQKVQQAVKEWVEKLRRESYVKILN